ncbi:hypothetical protein QE365_003387 [Acinetobacter baylyi]|uniref:hypothetical protein n=1 Tax=Acinetobacter baylyi TaxID=202950 RepID=UPI002863A53F|nr:hypothetical protein [Acinetobacter baylyi]MDR6108113.1 hypothetical protein [Acinetobacter baylyi]
MTEATAKGNLNIIANGARLKVLKVILREMPPCVLISFVIKISQRFTLYNHWLKQDFG